jgi:exodeoxyribonuclease VII large subunit
MQEQAQSVSDFVNQVKHTLEPRFQRVWIRGEISNYRPSSSGHTYFTLSDRLASVSMVLFRGDMIRNPEAQKFRDGDEVMCFGDVSVYAKRGTFQVIVKIIKAVGKGDLQADFEKLKMKLSGEGLFDLEQKQAIPEFPLKVAVITSPTGAAVKDFLQVYSRRALHMDVMLVPAVVQGEKAPPSIRNALFHTLKFHMDKQLLDAIVITRGGGSMEDLWCFNDEGLAYDIFNSPVPIISAIGHERDFTISDFVADLRCETPTAAAEYLTQAQTLFTSKMHNLKRVLNGHGKSVLANYERKIVPLNPKLFLDKTVRKVESWQRRLENVRLADRISFNDYELLIDDLRQRLKTGPEEKIKDHHSNLDKMNSLLNALGPKQVLQRGYSFIKTDDKVVADQKSFDKLKKDTELEIHFHDGRGKVAKL